MNSMIESPRLSTNLVYGCMRICGDKSQQALMQGKQALTSAVDAGYTHFDHADIYAGGDSERLFGEFLKKSSTLRHELFIISKAGIKPENNKLSTVKQYDFSHQHLTQSVDDSLSRLGIERLDMFMLHRPDYLMDIHQVANTLEQLKRHGKINHIGVSNFTISQVAALQSALSLPIIANQVEINIDNISAINDGSLDYCQQHNITPMAWCPLGGAVYDAWNKTLNESQSNQVHQTLTQQGLHYNVPHWVIALTWLLKHPANILPIIGSTTPARINTAMQAINIEYTRDDWYALLQARNGQSVP